MEISWFDYIYYNNRKGLESVFSSFDEVVPPNREEAYAGVMYLQETYGSEADKRLLEVHPEYKSISKLAEEKQEAHFNFAKSQSENRVVEAIKDNSIHSFSTSKVQILNEEIKRLKQTQTLLTIGVVFLLYKSLSK